jgi:hypothetical protein
MLHQGGHAGQDSVKVIISDPKKRTTENAEVRRECSCRPIQQTFHSSANLRVLRG